jgi:DNA-binding NarL/FixJ family response regulator
VIRILIVDDHLQTRKQIRQLLENHDGWQVVAEGSDGHEAILHAKTHDPHIVLLDIQMPWLRSDTPNSQNLSSDADPDYLISRRLVLCGNIEESGRKGIFAKTPAFLQIDSGH